VGFVTRPSEKRATSGAMEGLSQRETSGQHGAYCKLNLDYINWVDPLAIGRGAQIGKSDSGPYSAST
jgi:hypothetical protein